MDMKGNTKYLHDVATLTRLLINIRQTTKFTSHVMGNFLHVHSLSVENHVGSYLFSYKSFLLKKNKIFKSDVVIFIHPMQKHTDYLLIEQKQMLRIVTHLNT